MARTPRCVARTPMRHRRATDAAGRLTQAAAALRVRLQAETWANGMLCGLELGRRARCGWRARSVAPRCDVRDAPPVQRQRSRARATSVGLTELTLRRCPAAGRPPDSSHQNKRAEVAGFDSFTFDVRSIVVAALAIQRSI